MELELNCLRVRTPEHIAAWAVSAFELPITPAQLRRASVTGIFRERSIPDLDSLTSAVYHHVGKSGRCITVRVRHAWAMSRTLRIVLEDAPGWKREFGSGLPHDYGVAVSFKA